MSTQRQNSQERQRNPILWGVVVLALLAVVAFVIIGLFDDPADEVDTDPAQLGVTASEIIDNPEDYRDDPVTVSGEVHQVFGTLAFSIGGERFGEGQELLVVGPVPPVGGLADDEDPLREDAVYEEDIVQLTGQVIDFDEDTIQEELGAELEGEIPEELTQQPVLLAEGTVITPRAHTDAGEMVDVEDIISEPDEHVGEIATIEGDITEAIGDYLFVVDDSILVIDSSETMTEAALEDAEMVEATGEIMMFDAAGIGDETGIELDQDELEQFEDQPVMVADSILILPEEA